jgi:signal transduction histidine kinase
MSESRLRWWLLYAFAWVMPVVAYVNLLQAKTHVRATLALSRALAHFAPAALLGVAVWWLSGRVHLDARRSVRFVFAHLANALVFSSVWLAVDVAQRLMFGGAVSTLGIARGFAGWQLVTGCWIYGIIAAVAHIIRMTTALHDKTEAAALAEAERSRAQLRALRGQMNPHFLFNTLHSVHALVGSSPGAATDAIERLGGLFRYVLEATQADDEDVRVAEEWAFVQDYLALESLRLGTRLRVIESIAPDTLNCVLPVLTVQPLVENAIVHAVAPRRDGATIELRAHRRNGVLTIEVQDDGPGADAADALNARGVGLRSVRERIETRHPERGRFEVRTVPGGGFHVMWSIPADDGMPVAAVLR